MVVKRQLGKVRAPTPPVIKFYDPRTKILGVPRQENNKFFINKTFIFKIQKTNIKTTPRFYFIKTLRALISIQQAGDSISCNISKASNKFLTAFIRILNWR